MISCRAQQKMTNRSVTGQALLESLISLPIFFGAFFGGLVVTALALRIGWVEFSLYESLICLVEEQSRYSCESILRNRLSFVLLDPTNSDFRISRGLQEAKGEVVWNDMRNESVKLSITDPKNMKWRPQ